MTTALNNAEHHILTLFRALTPDKQAMFLNFQQALNCGDMEACRRFCEGCGAEEAFNAFLARLSA